MWPTERAHSITHVNQRVRIICTLKGTHSFTHKKSLLSPWELKGKDILTARETRERTRTMYC